MGELLGSGGYGEVYRAVWKGTDVAVKKMTSEAVTKDMQRNFIDEVWERIESTLSLCADTSLCADILQVRVMTALRHPNVVLFMAACTKPPHLLIVMELMSLGSLYDVCIFYRFLNILTNMHNVPFSQQLLHNELIAYLPIALRIKMGYQAAKGMYFLHSSGNVTSEVGAHHQHI